MMPLPRRLVALLLPLLLLLVTGCAARSSNAVRHTDAIKEVWAVEGEDIDLPCEIWPSGKENDLIRMILWFKDDANIPIYTLDARNLTISDPLSRATGYAVGTSKGSLEGRYWFLVDGGSSNTRLRIKGVTYEDQGEFRCRVDLANSPTRDTRINLTLIVPSSKPIIYDAQGREVLGVAGPFLEGYDLQLTCQVSGGIPRPRVTWWKGDEMLDSAIDNTLDMLTSNKKFTINNLQIKVTRSLYGSRLECRSESREQEKSKIIVRRVPLDIYLKPVSVIISQSEDIIAGRPVTMRCDTWGSSPAARIIWKLGDLVMHDSSLATSHRSNSTASQLALVLEKEDDGKNLNCRAENPSFPGGFLEKTKVLRVLYAPTATAHLAQGYGESNLKEGEDITLGCNYHSNPEPTSIQWYHDDKRIEHNVTEGVLVASTSLTLRQLSLVHNGFYSCLVRNTIGEARSSPVEIRIKYTPRCKEGYENRNVMVLPGEVVRLQCQVEANPWEDIRFSWTRNSSLGDVTAVTNPRPMSSSLEYKPKIDADFGTIACWASSSFGRQKSPCIFNIQPAKPPQKPTDCNIRNETAAMEVNCIPGASGGMPQHFVLEVRGVAENSGGLLQQIPQSDQGIGSGSGSLSSSGVGPNPEASTSGAIYQDRQEEPSFFLYDLLPGYYTVYVYAENNHGRSQPVLIENIRISEPVHRKAVEGKFLSDLADVIPHANSVESAFIVIGLIIGASLVLVGLGCAVGMVMCRRRGRNAQRTPREAESLDDFTTPTYIAAQRVEPRSRYGSGSDRRRSQRTSLYMEDTRNDPDLLQQVDIDLLNS